MRHRAIVLAGALSMTLLIATVRCASEDLPDPATTGCTESAAQAALTGCNYQLPGDVVGTNCLSLPNAMEALAAGNYSVMACQEEHASLLINCIANNVAQCAYEIDAGFLTVPAQCAYTSDPDASTPAPDCATTCQQARTTCESACTTSSATACFNCSFACGTTLVSCLAACPAATDAGS